MRCSSCDYPLWNLRARACPECGTAFKPSDGEFVVNSVRFCCPYCDQPYYGTGDQGHLSPRRFECVQCRRAVDMDEMILRPAEGVAEERTQVDRMPWLQRREVGRIRAWFSTVGLSLVAPNRLMRGLPQESPVGQAWWFAVVTMAVMLLGGVGLPFVGFGVVLLLSGDNDGLSMVLVGLSGVVGGAIGYLLWVVVWGVAAHLLLHISGRSTFGIGRTYEAICYSCGTNAIVAIPCLGPYCGTWVGHVWWVVSAVLMIMVGQRVSGARASLAGVTAPATMVLILVLGYFGLIYSMMSGGGLMATAISTDEAEDVTTAIVDYANAHSGAGPAYGLVLDLDGMGFIMQSSNTLEEDVPVGERTLEGLALLGPNDRREEAERIAEEMPEDLIAHRVGDCVFTYHGIDLRDADSNLWIVIMHPDPDTNPGVSDRVAVGFADGSVRMMRITEQAMDLQNERAQVGLLPLPIPSNVTHANPATEP